MTTYKKKITCIFSVIGGLLLLSCNSSDSQKRTYVPTAFEQENKSFIDILYASQSLDELSRILERQDAGPASGYWYKFLKARDLRSQDKKDSAILVLRSILPDADASRSQLWTWNALRELGADIPGSDADKMLGFVVELPSKGETAYLSGYSDGSIRYLDAATEPVIWDTPLPAFQKHLQAILSEGQKLQSGNQLRSGRSSRIAEYLKISFLTPSGILEQQAILVDVEQTDHPLNSIFIHIAAILDIIKNG